MRLLNWLLGDTPSYDLDWILSDDDPAINPATGLPMIGGGGGVDVEGNACGFSSDDDFD